MGVSAGGEAEVGVSAGVRLRWVCPLGVRLRCLFMVEWKWKGLYPL